MDAYPVRATARPRGRRLLKAALAAATSLTLAFAGVALESIVPSPAVAGPVTPTAGTTTITTVGAFSGATYVVPQGICTVTATVLGAAGGSAGVAAVTNGNGAGARVTATFPVVPGMSYSGTVGGGGTQPSGNSSTSTAGVGGTNGGGAGGTSGETGGVKHHGAGGGGYSELIIGGTSAILAGGGGGGGGGHSISTAGQGGNAGLPSGTGVTVGTNGATGKDTTATNPQPVNTGGGGGGLTLAGAGGTNSNNASTNGTAGSGRSGGAGGTDPNPDAGGGGGGGYTGGGGGASTVGYNTQNGSSDVAGAGGGGGSSYVAASIPLGASTSTPSGISSAAGAKIASGAGNGAAGSISLVWNPCDYDLAVDKNVSPASVPRNGTVTWSVAVTNLGPSAMTQGDTVTLTDTLPGVGAKTITSISVSGGSNAVLGRGTFSCTVGVGGVMPASLDCSRPYQIGAGAASGVRGLDVGETLTITYTQPVTEVAGTTLTNTATVTDRTTGDTNDSDTAATTVIVPPGAVNDVRTGLAIGTVVAVPVTTNDTGTLQADSVVLWNPTTLTAIPTPYVVAGEGTWTVANDIVTFTPQAGFKGDPTPVTYRVSATNGLTDTATVTLTYLPVAVDDSQDNLVIGAVATVPVLTNDNGTFDTGSLRLINPTTSATVTSILIANEGTWSVSGTSILFTPLPGFVVDPTPIRYQITDTTGDIVNALITLDYVPQAANNTSLGNALGAVVNQSVLLNDTGSFTASSLVFAANGGTTLTVPTEGVWTVQPGGVVRFTPNAGYYRDPTPVTYRVTDVTGDQVTATVTVGYLPAAVDDSSLGHALGSVVDVAVVSNDQGEFTAGSVRLMNGLIPVTTLTVPTEGTWTVVATDIIRFTPLGTFFGDPTPVYYRVTDVTGDNVSATVTVGYLPGAVDDHQGGLAIGSTATVPVLTNDNGTWNTGTLQLVHPTSGASVSSITVATQGTWTVSGTNIVFTPLPTFQLDPTPQSYRITDTTGDVATATVTLDYGPAALADSSLGNALGTVVELKVLTNDTGSFDTATLGFGPGNVGIGAQLVVAGQGTWDVVAAGVIHFTPLATFLGDPTPVTYYIDDLNGDSTSATMTITYVPAASDDSDLGNAWGTDVNVDVLANDHGAFPNGSVRILDGGTPVMTLPVAGEGTWIVEADDTITFHPEATFLTDPTPIRYRAIDSTGDPVDARVTVTYLPQAVDDTQGGLTIGSVATVPVLTNDHGIWVNASLRLIHPTTGVASTSVTVATQGTWSVSGTNVLFTPAPGFLVDPDPIDYRITDTSGDDAIATITLDYGPGAADDTDLGNALGTAVDVSVFGNDSGTFDPATLGFGAGTGPGTQLVVIGEGTWEVLAAGVVRFTPEPGFLTDPTPVRYYADDVTGDPADALITVTYLPLAADDSDLGNAFGTTVNLDVLGNDTGSFVAGSVRLLDGGTPTTVLTVPGEGTWTVEADDTVTFVPLATFLVDPTPVDYRVTDVTGDDVTATITVTYLPEAVDDSRGGLAIGTVVDIKVHTNDLGAFVAASTRLVHPTSGASVTSLLVAGQGTWSLSAAGQVRFTPAPGFLTDPDPIDYRATDSTGDVVTATITLDYVPAAQDDSDLGNVMGTAVDLDVFGNDSGDFDLATLGFGAGTGVGTQLVVVGEGTWEVLAGGIVRFTPEPGFLTDPTPVRYVADDVTGDPVDALLTVTYLPAASDDSDLGNVLGTNVNVDVLANDTGVFTAGSVRLMDGLLPVLTLTVAGEGVWTVQADDTITFDPDAGFLTDPSVVHYRVTDTTGDTVSATITVTYLPQATDNSSAGHAAGTTVNVNVLGNDTGTFVANSVRILDAGTPVLQLIVAGEGRWLANNDGTITFFPQAGYFGDPTAIDYEVTDVTGDTVSAQLRIAYLPVAAVNQSNGNVLGSPAVVDPLANDTGTFDPTSVLLLDGVTPVTSLTVAGEGTWTVNTATGVVTFTPAPGYQGNPSPVTYQVTDVTGDTVQATITVNYTPTAADDQSLGNKAGDPVTVSLLPNDAGAIAAGSARLLSGGSRMMTLVVPGQGTWRMNAASAQLTFTPIAGFLGDPTPVQYQVLDVNGNPATAQVTITYLHAAALALTGMEVKAPLTAALVAIALGLIALAVARLRRITARHRA